MVNGYVCYMVDSIFDLICLYDCLVSLYKEIVLKLVFKQNCAL